MLKIKYVQRVFRVLIVLCSGLFGLLGCGGQNQASNAPNASVDTPSSTATSQTTRRYTTADLDEILKDPIKRSDLIVKIMGSTAREDTIAFLKFHVYGYAGENLIPFFSMNNVIVQNWTPE